MEDGPDGRGAPGERGTAMTSAREHLIGLRGTPDRFAATAAELRDLQVAALDERLQERRGRIRLLAKRADDAGLDRITERADVVPVLFPHSVYKSYPDAFLADSNWAGIAKWMGTISPYPIAELDWATVTDLDDFCDRLEAAGNFVSCSSGTAGKSAMLLASAADLDWNVADTAEVFSWGSGVAPDRDRRNFGLAPTVVSPRNRASGDGLARAFALPDVPPYRLELPPITVGGMTRMVVLRKAIAEGTARPDEIAAFDATTQERAEAMERAYVLGAEALIEARHEKLFISGMWNALYQVATLVRERGFAAADFHPDNCIYVGGGLKRAQLPDDYQEFVHQTFNIPADREFQNYSMQELNSGMPRCRDGRRYHVPPWVVPFVLDVAGEAALPHTSGAMEGRAAFFDLSLDGRWGGVITGDRITLDLDPCPCGMGGPTVHDTIVRYADLQGDDKIGCAGTVDAYVRGLS